MTLSLHKYTILWFCLSVSLAIAAPSIGNPVSLKAYNKRATLEHATRRSLFHTVYRGVGPYISENQAVATLFDAEGSTLMSRRMFNTYQKLLQKHSCAPKPLFGDICRTLAQQETATAINTYVRAMMRLGTLRDYFD